jgi:hypothetical protein
MAVPGMIPTHRGKSRQGLTIGCCAAVLGSTIPATAASLTGAAAARDTSAPQWAFALDASSYRHASLPELPERIPAGAPG